MDQKMKGNMPRHSC